MLQIYCVQRIRQYLMLWKGWVAFDLDHLLLYRASAKHDHRVGAAITLLLVSYQQQCASQVTV
jgi:hypothetical protein